MLTHCFFCHSRFPANEQLERFPAGHRVAFDPARGRLWGICGRCARWSLVPIEARWEALEELERLSIDAARLLARTDNIALLRAGRLELVRVGRAELREEAWWRYGRELLRRRRFALPTGAAELALTLALGVHTGFGRAAIRSIRFGGQAWRGDAACDRCGRPLRRLSWRGARGLLLAPGDDPGTLLLRRECGHCAWRARGAGWIAWSGDDSHRLLRRVLAYHNAEGASRPRVAAAVEAVLGGGSPDAYVASLAARRPMLDELARLGARTERLALEIALSDASERALLAMELQEIERRWHEEETVAGIADRELTPGPEPVRAPHGPAAAGLGDGRRSERLEGTRG